MPRQPRDREGPTPSRTESPQPERRRMPWGWRRMLATCPTYVVSQELVNPGARTGVCEAPGGPLTVAVQSGVLWVREPASGATARLTAGQAYVTAPGRSFELATGAVPATILRVQPPRLEMAWVPGPVVMPMVTAGRAGQPSLEDRAAAANAAQGLSRVQPLPGQPRTAADVDFAFNQHGVNLAPVVPEP